MDAARAAEQSDPDRNPHFRRRWTEADTTLRRAWVNQDRLGTLGLALLEALRRHEVAGLDSAPSRDGGPRP